jgi:hypothetical protein
MTTEKQTFDIPWSKTYAVICKDPTEADAMDRRYSEDQEM